MTKLALVLLAGSLALPAAAQPRQNLLEYVGAALQKDKAYSPAERNALVSAIRDRFADYGLDVVPAGNPAGAKVVLHMITEGSFDEVPAERVAEVSFAAYQAVKRGAPVDVVEGIALYGYQKKIPGDRISVWANGYRQMVTDGVPADVAADLVHNAEARDWDDGAFDIFKWALVQGAKDGFNPRDYATYLFGHMIAGGQRPGALTATARLYFQKLKKTHEKPVLPDYVGVFSPKPPAAPAPAPAVEAPPTEPPVAQAETPATQPPPAEAPEVESPKIAEPKPSKPKAQTPRAPRPPAKKEAPLSPSISALWPGLDRSVLSYLGTPYVWGGTTHAGIDCSALTQNSYGENDVRIPRVSKDQWKTGTAIEQPQLRQGDLIFFDTLGNGVSHVGMIVDPSKGPQFAHASSSHGVMLQDLSKKYYQTRYLGARRVVP